MARRAAPGSLPGRHRGLETKKPMMKTAMIGLLLMTGTLVLVPGASALNGCEYPPNTNVVECELRNTWVACGGNYYRGDYVYEHPEVLLTCA
jgi:hypothetical protein